MRAFCPLLAQYIDFQKRCFLRKGSILRDLVAISFFSYSR